MSDLNIIFFHLWIHLWIRLVNKTHQVEPAEIAFFIFLYFK